MDMGMNVQFLIPSVQDEASGGHHTERLSQQLIQGLPGRSEQQVEHRLAIAQ
jgi:hypothetical protein